MMLHKCIVRPEIRTSQRFARLNWLHRDLFYGLLNAAQGDGWFEASAQLLRAALYAPSLGKVSERDVRDGLLKLREVGLIKLWTGTNGRAYGQIHNYGQKFDYGRGLPEEARAPSDELPLDAAPLKEAEPEPPPRPEPARAKDNRIEMSGRGERAKRAAPDPKDLPSTEDWLAQLRESHPGIDIDRELRTWQAYCQKQGKQPQRPHFEAWLRNCGPVVTLASTGSAAVAIEPEPEAWRAYLKDKYEDEGWADTASHYDWAQMPANWRAKIAREMKGAA
jgi:hypothetical protein